MVIRRAAADTLPTTPEQWEEIRTNTRRALLDQINPILTELAQENGVICASTLIFTDRSGRLTVKFPELNSGGIECEIAFDLGVKRIGTRYDRGGYVSTGAVFYKTFTGPSSRYFAGNWKLWSNLSNEGLRNYLSDFFRVAKIRHEQRTAATTRKPRIQAALETVGTLDAKNVEVRIQTDIGGLFQSIERRLTFKKEVVREVYIYDYDQECLVLNRKEISYTQPIYVRL